jgi:RecA-family ATPase
MKNPTLLLDNKESVNAGISPEDTLKFQLPPPVGHSGKSLPGAVNLDTVWTQELPQLDFVLPGLVAGTVGMLMAAGGTGKSILALELAIAVAGGPDLLNLGVSRLGRVLVVAAEDPLHVLAVRLKALAAHLPAQARAAVMSNLEVIPTLGTGVELYTAGADDWELALTSRGRGCRLIVIDTLSRVHSGEENRREDAAKVMRRLENIALNTGAAVLVLHHVAKAAALNGQGQNQQAARGASVWVDEARFVAYLVGLDSDTATKLGIDADRRRSYLRYGVAKGNYAPPLPDTWLRRDVGGVLLPASITKAPKAPTERKSRPTALVNIPQGDLDEVW